MMIGGLFVFLFCNCLASLSKEEDQRCIEKVKEYLKSIKDFDELVSPQSLFLHFWVQNHLLRFGRIWKL